MPAEHKWIVNFVKDKEIVGMAGIHGQPAAVGAILRVAVGRPRVDEAVAVRQDDDAGLVMKEERVPEDLSGLPDVDDRLTPEEAFADLEALPRLARMRWESGDLVRACAMIEKVQAWAEFLLAKASVGA